MAEVALDYTPREAFLPFHNRTQRFSAMCCHRRAGKTVAVIHDLVLRAVYTKKKKAKFAYIGPYRAQAKDVAWEYLKEATEGIRLGPPREAELRVRFPNGATITLYGADNPKTLRGLYLDGAVIDEYADIKPSVWGEIILPTLLDRRGWAVIIGTIKGKNHFYQTLQKADKSESWYHMILKASESGIIAEEDLAEIRMEQDESQYQQEMECNPNARVKGTYYSSIIAKMEDTGQIARFDYDPDYPVEVVADLGYTDSSAWWFWQTRPDGPVLIDYYENDGEELAHYVEMLRDKPYPISTLWLPHDAKITTMQTGRSTVEQLIGEGFECQVVPRLAVQHGIDAARLMLHKVRIDGNNCAKGVEALRAYRRQFNEKTQQFQNVPLHDWASNGADAFRYFALVTAEGLDEVAVIPEQRVEGYCLEDLWQDKEQDDWRNHIIRI